MRILIIDDEESIRRSLREVLEFENHEIFEAKDARDALSKVNQVVVDLIFCDIKMPNMDGFEFLDRIKTISSVTPIVMMSGHASDNDQNRCFSFGASDYISKPLDLGILLDTLKKHEA